MFHSFFNSLAWSRYLSFFSHSFSFILWSTGAPKSTILQVLFFLLIILGLAEIRWSVYMPKSHRSLCVLFSKTGAGLCIYHLFVWSKFSSSPEMFFLNFVFHFHLFGGVSLLDVQIFVGFVFCECSNLVLIW